MSEHDCLLVSTEPVVAREPAWPGVSGGVGGFGVDGGQACFTDRAAVPGLTAYLREPGHSDTVVRRVIDRLWATVPGGSGGSGGNTIVFDCGMGDGDYAAWLGRTGDGVIGQVAADLELLRHCAGPVGQRTSVPAERGKRRGPVEPQSPAAEHTTTA